MTVLAINYDAELKKAAKGKKTVIPVEMVLYCALQDYPHIQRLIGKAFGIKED